MFHFSTFLKISLAIFSLLILFLVGYTAALLPYRYQDFGLKSELADSLRIFFYNESAFPDPVAACWYDSGDYTIFLQRDAEAFYYLSLAYDAAQNLSVKKDLELTLGSQKKCLDAMLAKNVKQIGDEDSHGVNLPPLIHRLFYPRRAYEFNPNEGKDVYLLYGLASKNLGASFGAAALLSAAAKREGVTLSANCCEEGPLKLSATDLTSLEALADGKNPALESKWGVSFADLAILKRKNYSAIKNHLSNLEKIWREEKDRAFHYIGGNYDIAGTVALERLYAQAAGDESFKNLSGALVAYLKGENDYGVDFLNYPDKYHPCDFFPFADCRLRDTLVNGVDETHEFDTDRRDVWRLSEVQLVGQAKYILAKVLFESL